MFLPSPLISITSEQTENFLLLHLNNRTLILGQVNIDKSQQKGSVQLTPFDQVDKFCVKKYCLATYNNGKTQLTLHNLSSCASHEPIELDNECQELCLNESTTYVFVLLKSRVLIHVSCC